MSDIRTSLPILRTRLSRRRSTRVLVQRDIRQSEVSNTLRELKKQDLRELIFLKRYYRFQCLAGEYHVGFLAGSDNENMNKYIVVEDLSSWADLPENAKVISAREYLTDPKYSQIKKTRVFNLCQNYSYQSIGYYVSLLAEARGHIALPAVKNLVDLKDLTLVRMVCDAFDELIQKSLKDIRSEQFTLSVYFGQNVAKKYKELSTVFHRYFQIPLMRIRFRHSGKWRIEGIRAISISEVPEDHRSSLKEFTEQYFSRRNYPVARPAGPSHDLAILVSPADPAPPSNTKALKKFVETAEKLNFRVEMLRPADFSRLSAFDALFIRMNTEVHNGAYAFARKAEQEGLALIDYPSAILRCCNKVYMAEALENAGLKKPQTLILHRENREDVIRTLGFPVVLKSPDSSFSFGVKKAENETEYFPMIDKMLEHSELVIAQEYLPSEYDWRIGILDQQPLFACRYYMARGHWQIYNWKARKKGDQDGNVEAMAIEDVPDAILKTAMKAAKLMGDGLYGVDLKEVNGSPIVIEINDNPNIDFGVEDGYYGDKIYLKIIRAFKERIDRII